MTDQKDIDILYRLMRDPFISFAEVARPLGLSGAAVKARLDRLREDGVLQGIWGVPVPQVFQRHARLFVYRTVQRRDQALDLALRTDPVVRAAEGYERGFEVVTFAKTRDAAAPAELVARFGEPDLAATILLSDPKERDCVLSSLDWRILLPLVRLPRAPVEQIAMITGLSRKTVRQRRSALVRKNLFRVIPLVAGARGPGFVIYRLFVQTATAAVADRHRILTALSGTVLMVPAESQDGLWLSAAAPTLAQAVRSRELAETIPGVTDVEIEVFMHDAFAPERVEGWIRERLAEGERAPSTAS